MDQIIPNQGLAQRESHFSAFIAAMLEPFWQQRQEWRFNGVNDIPIQCVRFTSPQHSKAIVIVSGFMESYVKYQELIYDFFHSGYDVFMFDHRGQGFSGHILNARNRVYVERFSDYVDDLAAFWQTNVAQAHYRQRYLLGHSMGGAIAGLFLTRRPATVNAAILSAPMAGIKLPMPLWCANLLINVTQRSHFLRQTCVIKSKSPPSFKLNLSCNSEQRYQRLLDLYRRYPEIWLHGPTYHWVKEALAAGEALIASACSITTPLLLLQAGKEHLVSNSAQDEFMRAVRRPDARIIRYEEAAHEILFNVDRIRAAAFNQILDFFKQYQ